MVLVHLRAQNEIDKNITLCKILSIQSKLSTVIVSTNQTDPQKFEKKSLKGILHNICTVLYFSSTTEMWLLRKTICQFSSTSDDDDYYAILKQEISSTKNKKESSDVSYYVFDMFSFRRRRYVSFAMANL